MVNNTQAVIGLALVLLVLFIFYGCSCHRDNFTRTCVTADTNCKFVRSPVDYANEPYNTNPFRIGRTFPHLMGKPTDKLQPLEDGRVNLNEDEEKLWDQDKLWKQYEHHWKGCGNGQPYIVNDEKTRFALREVGDEWAVRALYGMRTPLHGPEGRIPAYTEQDFIKPDPFDRIYGGKWIPQQIGV